MKFRNSRGTLSEIEDEIELHSLRGAFESFVFRGACAV